MRFNWFYRDAGVNWFDGTGAGDGGGDVGRYTPAFRTGCGGFNGGRCSAAPPVLLM